MSDLYTLESAAYEEGRITATYVRQHRVGTGYEGEAVYEPSTDVRGNPDETVTVQFYAAQIAVRGENRNYSGGGNKRKDALDKAASSMGPLDTADLERFDEQFGDRDMATFVESQCGRDLDAMPDDPQLHTSEVVNGKQVEVTFRRAN